MSHRPEEGSYLEQILGFYIMCYSVFWILDYSSCKRSKIAAQRGMCACQWFSRSSNGIICEQVHQSGQKRT